MQTLSADTLFRTRRAVTEPARQLAPASAQLHYEVADKVWGPFGRFYIAAYAVRLGSGEHIAYAKVFNYRPRDYWDGSGIAKFATDMTWASGSSAILDAVFVAQYWLERRYGSPQDADLETGPAPLMDLKLN
jgi:hypothetical protein